MSDYLASLAAKSINQNQGVRFLGGELRPHLASRFEPPFASAAAWPESPPLVEEVTEHEAVASEVPSASPVPHLDLPEAGEIPSPIARVIEGIRPLPTGQDRPAEHPVHDSKNNESSRSENELSHSMSPQAQSTSLTIPVLQSGAQPPHRRSPSIKTAQTLRAMPATSPEVVFQETAGRVLDRAQSFRVEQQSLPEQSSAAPAALDQSAEPQHVNQRGDRQQPDRRQPASPLSPRLAVANAVAQVESAITNGAIPSQMPTPGQNLGVLQSVLARLREPREQAELKAAPAVNVTIGRVEVRATPPPPVSAPKPRATPVMSLEEYLRRRAAGGSS
jgi:hypothetical protein